MKPGPLHAYLPEKRAAKPPLVPLPGEGDADTLEDLGVIPTSVSRWVARCAMAISGFRKFERSLPEHLEELLRSHNLRVPGLFAPVISATLAFQNDGRVKDPLLRAATLLRATKTLYDDIISGRFEPDRHRGAVLEMGQYPNLFSTCLILENGQTRMFKSNCISDVLVVARRQYYVLHVGQSGWDASVEELAASLGRIVADAASHTLRESDPSPGLLTCANNRTQRRAFSRLAKVAANRESLAAVRHSFVTLCLDLEMDPASLAEAARVAHSGNCANRWYHSSLAAAALIELALKTYQQTNEDGMPPVELFIHGKVRFNPEEWEGFASAVGNATSLVGVKIRDDSSFRLYRKGENPVLRGLAYVQGDTLAYLWTSGFVPRVQTYPGREVPGPLSIEICRGQADMNVVLQDIMSLTKLNYNACIFSDGVPVTLRFADAVGEILTAGPVPTNPPLSFRYYI